MKTRRQLAFRFRTWGGARKGAGRPPKGAAAGVSHLRRPALSRHHPVHVTLRIVAGVPSLRGALFNKVRSALAEGQERFGFRLVHFSVQSNHLHLIAEAADRRALSRGMQGLSIRVARAVNGALSRAGRLFADRYHARALTTPRATYFALRYVLLNARKHQRSPRPPRAAVEAELPTGFVDSCSSAPWFDGFSRPAELAFGAASARRRWRASSEREAPVVPARTWLLRRGARRYAAFDVDDAPAPAKA
ncbi:MAG TPA: transposase [Polyangiaceae bacterium]|nr:transposase [Polyangiaceae bacterium]